MSKLSRPTRNESVFSVSYLVSRSLLRPNRTEQALFSLIPLGGFSLKWFFTDACVGEDLARYSNREALLSFCSSLPSFWPVNAASLWTAEILICLQLGGPCGLPWFPLGCTNSWGLPAVGRGKGQAQSIIFHPSVFTFLSCLGINVSKKHLFRIFL